MQHHTKVYLDYMKATPEELLCEYCRSARVNDIHHIIPRSHFGKKRKAEQDAITNLIGLCRSCHNKAHQHQISKEELLAIASKRQNTST
jgi:5-methylcytosine-specific restriction endonuclease McrA